MMTRDEHKLLIMMFARQTEMLKTVIELLKSRGLTDGEDLTAFQYLAQQQSEQIYRATVKEYREFAARIGVPSFFGELPETPEDPSPGSTG